MVFGKPLFFDWFGSLDFMAFLLVLFGSDRGGSCEKNRKTKACAGLFRTGDG